MCSCEILVFWLLHLKRNFYTGGGQNTSKEGEHALQELSDTRSECVCGCLLDNKYWGAGRVGFLLKLFFITWKRRCKGRSKKESSLTSDSSLLGELPKEPKCYPWSNGLPKFRFRPVVQMKK